ncbi:pilus assembly protein Flp/PilA [Janthinobacterium lividum]|uniref:Pilus assembly protein Flp/PilA n=2 Tax=Janthinobacterium lividum TaxID=29581 RepID=A0AB38CDP5_9BURK|nr:pilus assembly protein Flp/PilA [Janthinobacterium lividum]
MFPTRLRQGLVIHFWELVMHTFLSAVHQFVKDEDGITAIEYGLIAALMATAITAGFLLIKTNLLAVLTDISSNLVLTP